MDQTQEDARAQRDRIIEALRNHAIASTELGRRFGATMGVHHTDANALVEILNACERGVPLTQSELSQRIGLTTGATSSLLNRLETAGHIRRVRDSADRRIVTLQPTPGVEAVVDSFFRPLADRMGALMDRYPPELLKEFESFLSEISSAMNRYAEVAPRGGRLSAATSPRV